MFCYWHWLLPILSWFLQRTSSTCTSDLLHGWQCHHQTPSHTTLPIVFMPFWIVWSMLKGLAAASTWYLFFELDLNLFITLLIFVWRCDIISKVVLPPYQMHSYLKASRYDPSTAWRMSVQILSSTPKNFSYSITFLACFFSLLLLSNAMFLAWWCHHTLLSLLV